MLFVPTVEVSCIYTRGGRGRRVHIIVVAPTLAVAKKINDRLGAIGNIVHDGRPILGLDCEELTTIVLDASPESLIIPAHCLAPGEGIHTENGVIPIEEIKVGDRVLTHTGRFRPVTELKQHVVHETLYHIQPRNFRIGIRTTGEHPFYAMKTRKKCDYGGVTFCRPIGAHATKCHLKSYRKYTAEWIQAKNLEVNDVLLYPRLQGVKDKKSIDLVHVLKERKASWQYSVDDRHVITNGKYTRHINRTIQISDAFCHLIGYYLAEGYTNGRDGIGFTFHRKEQKYVDDVKNLMRLIFGAGEPIMRDGQASNSIEITYYSKPLFEFFSFFCYVPVSAEHRAHTKAIPQWMMFLPYRKQAEIIRGWWRGDRGYTVSRQLMNQMKTLFLRLGILPSIHEDTAREHTSRGNHEYNGRVVRAQHTLYQFLHLSFFENSFDLLNEHEFSRSKTKLSRRYSWMDDQYVYIPIRDIQKEKCNGPVYNLEVEDDNSYVTEFAAVHNCWTPWFGVFGSKSGFDALEECFGEMTKYIYAIETGLSSDPKMNWRLSALDRIAILSFSDAHSLPNLGREATVLDLPVVNYTSLIRAIQKKTHIVETLEFFPEEGKYHADGHRDCGVRLFPEETKKHGGRCPKCKKPVTVGVLARVDALADRTDDVKPKGAASFRSIVPLQEMIAEAFQYGKQSKRVQAMYEHMIQKIGNEFFILTDAPLDVIVTHGGDRIAEAIRRVRDGHLTILPGYDGVYGTIRVFSNEERLTKKPQKLFDF